MSGIRFRWLSLTTYMKMMTNLHNIPIKSNEIFDFDSGINWHEHVKAIKITIKAATIVMYDRFGDK